ncbi:MAG: lipocalin family protein [Alphaproteobacteria bacterium]|nr:lipocalin family protein [Alphaproteobacteria bacterium]
MKKILLLAGAMMCFLSFKAHAVTTVDSVDLTRYVGQWYEIASMPQWFQKECVGGVQAKYSTLPNGRIQVANSCLLADGTRKVTLGEAKVTDKNTNAKLRVTFAKVFNKYIYTFGGDYWVIDLEPNYKYAVVGHPTLKFGWILARDAKLSDDDLLLIADNLKSQGYDTCKFITTVQEGGIQQKVRLCDYLKGRQ